MMQNFLFVRSILLRNAKATEIAYVMAIISKCENTSDKTLRLYTLKYLISNYSEVLRPNSLKIFVEILLIFVLYNQKP